MQNGRARLGCDGFTLVEVLAALAIASVIIMASAALIRNVALFFDRGTRGVTEAERLMLAVERLAGDSLPLDADVEHANPAIVHLICHNQHIGRARIHGHLVRKPFRPAPSGTMRFTRTSGVLPTSSVMLS